MPPVSLVMRKVPAWFSRRLKMVNSGLYVIQHPMTADRYQIWWQDPRTAVRRFIYDVEDENGRPCALDEKIIIRLAQNVDWKCLHENPHPEETYDFFQNQRQQKRQHRLKQIEDDRQYRKKHFKKEFKEMFVAFKESVKNKRLVSPDGDAHNRLTEHRKKTNLLTAS